MPIKLNGATNGSVELDVPAAVGSDLQVTLPATAGEVVVKDGSGNITTTGTATFGGNVQVGGNPISGAANGSVALSDSGFIAANSNAAVPLWRGYTTGNSTQTSSILANGSATYSESVSINGGEGLSAALYLTADQGDDNGDTWRIISNQDDNDLTFSNNVSGSYADKVTFLNNGSATFAETVSGKRVNIVGGHNGVLLAGYDGNYSNYGNENVTITATGSATFKGVQVGGNPFPGTATGFAAYQDGSIALSSASSTGTIFFGYTQGSSTTTTLIKANGTATFAGTVTAGDTSTGCQWFANGSGIGRVSGTQKWYLNNNGNVVFAGSVTASNVSDIRFKENITDANPQLADAVALGSQLKNFDWKDDAPLNEELRAKRFLGLVAQEAEKVCPTLTYTVPRTKQGAELTPETTDAEGVVTPATYEELDDSYKAINHDILVMKLLGAVAEQNTQIETLKTKVAALEATS